MSGGEDCWAKKQFGGGICAVVLVSAERNVRNIHEMTRFRVGICTWENNGSIVPGLLPDLLQFEANCSFLGVFEGGLLP